MLLIPIIPQDLRTTASPTFTGLTDQDIIPIALSKRNPRKAIKEKKLRKDKK